jgi:hypothetical protein
MFLENDNTFTNILYLVEYSLSLPDTNAQVERVFSHVNDIWSPEKTQLKVETLKSIITTKLNINLTCLDFYKMHIENEAALKAIHSEKKYAFKKIKT